MTAQREEVDLRNKFSPGEIKTVTDFLSSQIVRWSVVGLAVALFAVSNLPWHLDDYDQAKQAFTSFEMVERGHWFYQHTPNWWVATKPPFVGWVSAGLYYLTHSWELAWRLPSFLAGGALLFWVWRAAGVYGSVAGLMAGAAFSLNLFGPRLASLVRTDMPLALDLFAVGWLVWVKIRARSSWTTRDRVLLFFLLSAGMLIKGPIVYAFVLPGLILFQWRWRATDASGLAWSGWLPWLLSFLVFVVWVAGGILFVPEFIEHVVLREFAGRFNGEIHHSQPVYFYPPHLFHRFAPWSVLLIGVGVAAWRRMDSAASGRNGIGAKFLGMSPETFWLIVWSLGGLLFMSFIPSKRIDRIFPIIPPLCLLLAVAVAAGRDIGRARVMLDRWCAVALIFAVLFTTGYTVRRIGVATREHRDAFAVFGRAVLKEVDANHWRYAVVGGEDEGMLLYVRRTDFLEPDQAALEWNHGRLDALVLPDDEIEGLLPRLHGAETRLTCDTAASYGKRYFLLARRAVP